jgi:hypothetical protein
MSRTPLTERDLRPYGTGADRASLEMSGTKPSAGGVENR